MVALTLDKRRAHDDRGNPISHIERWGFVFSLITIDGIINDEVLDKIKSYPIKIESEKDLANEIARIANLSLKKGY